MLMVPGGPFLSERTTQATLDRMNDKYGLDQPVYIQYGRYLQNALKGDLGMSYKRRGFSVSEIIAEKFPISAKLGGVAILCSILTGIPLGVLAAYRRNTWIDRVIMFFCTIGISFPSFVTSVVLLYVFGMNLKWLPTIGLNMPANYIMPVFALSFSPASYITRLTRSSMLDVNGMDYLKTARAKGLTEPVVLFKHALRNALIPVVTYLGPLVVFVISGGFVVERIFSVPGLGKYFIDSIGGRDYPMIMGTTIFLAGLIILANLIVDILYRVIDPRIKLM
jgi:oligopeptide transport system permease protein